MLISMIHLWTTNMLRILMVDMTFAFFILVIALVLMRSVNEAKNISSSIGILQFMQKFLPTIPVYIGFHLHCWNWSQVYCSSSLFCHYDALNFLCADGNIDERCRGKSFRTSTSSLSPAQHLLFESNLTSFLFLPVLYTYHTSSVLNIPSPDELITTVE